MSQVVPLSTAKVFLDTRGSERALRVSWHHEAHTVVLSLWQYDNCVGTFRLEAAAVPELVQALVEGLAGYADPAATGGSPPY